MCHPGSVTPAASPDQHTGGVDFDAVVLAGGAGTRLGGADKAALVVGGMSLLDRVLTACAGARQIVVVGPPRPPVRPVEWTLEQPPGGGPLAGLAAGMAVPGSSPLVLVLATDLPHLQSGDVHRLMSALAGAEPQVDGAVFVDDAQRAQPLTAIYRRSALLHALADLHPVADRPMRAMLSRLTTIDVPAGSAAADIDTAEHLAAARAALSAPAGED